MSRKRTRITPFDPPSEGRTTKPERRAARRRNTTACNILGDGTIARMWRAGVLLDEAKAFENMAADALYGLPPADLNDRVMTIIGTTPTYTAATGYDVESDGWINLRYPMHISLGTVPVPADQGQSLARVWESEVGPFPEGPGDYGDWDGDPWPLVPLTPEPAPSYDMIEDPSMRYRDPNEATAHRAEAVERALDDDHDPGE